MFVSKWKLTKIETQLELYARLEGVTVQRQRRYCSARVIVTFTPPTLGRVFQLHSTVAFALFAGAFRHQRAKGPRTNDQEQATCMIAACHFHNGNAHKRNTHTDRANIGSAVAVLRSFAYVCVSARIHEM